MSGKAMLLCLALGGAGLKSLEAQDAQFARGANLSFPGGSIRVTEPNVVLFGSPWSNEGHQVRFRFSVRYPIASFGVAEKEIVRAALDQWPRSARSSSPQAGDWEASIVHVAREALYSTYTLLREDAYRQCECSEQQVDLLALDSLRSIPIEELLRKTSALNTETGTYSEKSVAQELRRRSLSGVYFTYRQNSFWDLFLPEASAPFLDNNYSPGFSLVLAPGELGWGPGEWWPTLQAYYVHESNGREESESASPNRSLFRVGGRADFRTLRDPVSGHIDLWRTVQKAQENSNVEAFAGSSEIGAYIKPRSGLSFGQFGMQVLVRIDPWRTKGHAPLFKNVEFNVFLNPFPEGWWRASFVLSYFRGTGQYLLDYQNRYRQFKWGLAFIR